MMDKSTESKIRETRAADLTVSVNLDVKKENPGSKLKKKKKESRGEEWPRLL